jgi:hypothetical protein
MVLLWWFSLQLVACWDTDPYCRHGTGVSRLAPFLGDRKKPCRREGTSDTAKVLCGRPRKIKAKSAPFTPCRHSLGNTMAHRRRGVGVGRAGGAA